MASKYYEYIATVLKHARKRQGLSQQEVADAIGKNRPAYAQYERGAAAIDMATWSKIVKVLHIDSNRVMREAQEYEEAEL